jgi:conjugal transfer pilus assembly protein TraW
MVNIAHGKDLGTIGHTFPIQEQGLVSHIQSKLLAIPKDDMAKHQQRIIERAKAKLHSPHGLALPHATKHRKYKFNPAITVDENIYDVKGEVLIAKGTMVNPFANGDLFLTRDYLFIDGDDAEQISFAKELQGDVILVNGSVIDARKKLGREVKFDQHGALVKRLAIQNLPARLSQIGNELVVEEFVI